MEKLYQLVPADRQGQSVSLFREIKPAVDEANCTFPNKRLHEVYIVPTAMWEVIIEVVAEAERVCNTWTDPNAEDFDIESVEIVQKKLAAALKLIQEA